MEPIIVRASGRPIALLAWLGISRGRTVTVAGLSFIVLLGMAPLPALKALLGAGLVNIRLVNQVLELPVNSFLTDFLGFL